MPQLVSETLNRKKPNGITQSTGVREEEGKIGTKRGIVKGREGGERKSDDEGEEEKGRES